MVKYTFLGRVAYDEALQLQRELVELRYAGRIENTLLLLEHPPVLTLGRNASRSNVLASDELLAQRSVTLHEINRGGDVTYHGPGQLVGYPIFDLRSLRNPSGSRLGPVDFVRLIEEALIRVCAAFGVPAARIPGLTGVWCGVSVEPQISSKGPLRAAGKIGAIGIHVSRGVTSHGFAFNVTTDLRDFRLINPCGITDRPVTSLQQELTRVGGVSQKAPSLETVAQEAARQFGLVFDQPILALDSLDQLRKQAVSSTDSSASGFPAEDTPLRIPPELERLRGVAEHPTQA